MITFALAPPRRRAKVLRMDESIHVLRLYKSHDFWCFDDPDRGISEEPFVEGTDVLIDQFREMSVPGVERPLLMFSKSPFAGGISLQWEKQELRAGEEWNRYGCRDFGLSGWLCPVMLKYFPEAPPQLFARLCNWPNITAPAFTLARGEVSESEAYRP